MTRQIQLTITGSQKEENGETFVTKQSWEGEYFEKAGCRYLLYQENAPESGYILHNRIKLKDSVLELTKKGAVNTRMVFEPGKEYLTDYVTPYGCLKMGISTHSLEISPEEEKLKIRITYSLTSQGALLSRCILTILAVSAESRTP